MSAYAQLLAAAIKDLEDRKTLGERFVVVAPETLLSLSAPASRSHQREVAKPISPSQAAAPSPPARPALATSLAARANSLPVPPAPVRVPVAPVPSLVTTVAPADRPAAFAALRERVLSCTKCPHLVASRASVVFGVGNPDAQLMFVGEAPGADEDRQGEPFVGAAGQLLTKVIVAMGLTRPSVYIANVLKCRPDTPGQTYGNRKPRADEMGTCLPYLLEQIQLIQPRVIVALGGTAVEGLFGQAEVRITRLRGSWMDFQGIPVMPTFHPSYLLRAEEGPDKGRATKRQVWEDMLQVMERLQMTISEKQRGYFK